ncbi:hypothetical protein I656_01942 [Geobacillus sp. WSUCF1]|nr:hypothetical protein I656_01942 [Geobacillus sp. WSUCF1]
MRGGMVSGSIQESPISEEFLVVGVPTREEKSTHRHSKANAYDHLLHDLPQGAVPPPTT